MHIPEDAQQEGSNVDQTQDIVGIKQSIFDKTRDWEKPQQESIQAYLNLITNITDTLQTKNDDPFIQTLLLTFTESYLDPVRYKKKLKDLYHVPGYTEQEISATEQNALAEIVLAEQLHQLVTASHTIPGYQIRQRVEPTEGKHVANTFVFAVEADQPEMIHRGLIVTYTPTSPFETNHQFHRIHPDNTQKVLEEILI